ncbi:MAG: 2-amino-4-hydroxy-6-hydroxymethyldihydropteridine diphosphokinase [Vicinamibacterales bacterium]
MGRVAVAIALGSNVGDRESHLAFAHAQLSARLDGCQLSSVIETAPVDVPGDPLPFLNAALTGLTDLSPAELLTLLHEIEQARGRDRPFRNAPRTLDLDLILFGTTVIRSPDLVVPHPRFRTRLFVLEPLAEIAPNAIDPVTGLTIRALYDLAQAQVPNRPAG